MIRTAGRVTANVFIARGPDARTGSACAPRGSHPFAADRALARPRGRATIARFVSKDRAVLASLPIFLALGVVAGILAGLLGVGGGLVLVAALAWLLPTLGVPREAAMHAALASSLASIVLLSLIHI